MTQMISKWTYIVTDSDEPRNAGLRYESRVRSGWECWTPFDVEDLAITMTIPITADVPDLVEVADLFDIHRGIKWSSGRLIHPGN